MISTEIIHKEIDLIQSCINRMANNSFLLKGWYISLMAVVLAILLNNEFSNVLSAIFITLLITGMFWALDGFFLMCEKLYRAKYVWVIQKRIEGCEDYLYDLNPYNKNMWLKDNTKETCILFSIFSKTLSPFYGIFLLVSVVIFITTYYCC